MLSDLSERGDHAVEDWLVSANLRRIARSVARKYHLPDADFMDLVQETSAKIGRLDPRTLLNGAFVFRIAECRAKDYLRRAERRTASATKLPVGSKGSRDPELWLLLVAKIAELPEEARGVVELKLEGYSEREIATIKDLSRKVVRTRLAWAYRLLGRSARA